MKSVLINSTIRLLTRACLSIPSAPATTTTAARAGTERCTVGAPVAGTSITRLRCRKTFTSAWAASVTPVALHRPERRSAGTRMAKNADVTPPRRFADIDVGGSLACGIGADGAAACWDDGLFRAVRRLTGFFRSVSAQDVYACGVRSDGRVVCWGYQIEPNADAMFKSVSAASRVLDSPDPRPCLRNQVRRHCDVLGLGRRR